MKLQPCSGFMIISRRLAPRFPALHLRDLWSHSSLSNQLPLVSEGKQQNKTRLKERKTVWLSLPLSFAHFDSIPQLNSLPCLSLDSVSLHVFLSLSLGIASGTRCSPVNWPRPPIPTCNRDPAVASGATDTKSVALHTHGCRVFFMLSKHGDLFRSPRASWSLPSRSFP